VGLKSGRGIFLDTAKAEKKILELSKKYGLKVDPKAIVGNLSVGEQQRVEIIKALYREIDVLILDEPTSLLTRQEEEALFAALRLMVKQGLSIIFITHKLREVMAVSTRITILKNGKVVGTVNTSETCESDLARLMMGRSVVQQVSDRRHGCEAGKKTETILRIEDVIALNNSKTPSLRGLSLELRKAEIMGIAGVDGNGQTELAEVIAGLRKVERGHIVMAGRSIENLIPRKIREWGLAYVPDDLISTGLILEYTIAQNLILDRWYQKPYSGTLFLKEHEIRRFAEKMISEFDIRSAAGINSPVMTMSGGNMQKVVLARELSRKPKVLVAHNPTRGLDISATEYIHKQLITQKENGVGVLLISLDLEEILSMSDRIAVIYEGKIMDVFEKDLVDTDKIGLMIGGNLDKSSLQQNPPP
jgi:simple sugar transport system ATP-binding protein